MVNGEIVNGEIVNGEIVNGEIVEEFVDGKWMKRNDSVGF